MGTSGWVYRDWRGLVYPEDVPQGRWLAFLSRRFPTIEINATFYRLPSRATFESWAAQVPPGFRFAVKMSRYLTHVKRLRAPAEPVDRFWDRATGLGDALGPVLFQLPPTLRRDDRLLRGVLTRLPSSMRAAFEFRHPSWDDDAVRRLLDDAGAAWVLAHRPGAAYEPHVTGGWSYLRLHRATEQGWEYGPRRLRAWADRLAALPADPVYAYFNTDPGGAAARDAERLVRLQARDRSLA